jgi:uncharacterized protein YdhG (YjbR/CyaY superfamily)
VSAKDIDKVFATYPKEQKATLEIVRQRILEVIPEAQQCIKYGIPTFTVNGKGVAGIAATKKSCSYYPYSGQVLKHIPEVANWSQTQAALHFPNDKPLSKALIKKLINGRLALGL